MTDWSVDEFLDEYQAPTSEARVCPKVELLERHRELERELVSLRSPGAGSLADDTPRELAERLQELEDEIEASTKAFHFRALSRRRWRALLAEHPPRKEHKTEGLDFHPETFPVAAIAACAVDPELTPDQADRLVDTLPLGEFEKMWAAVLDVNLGVNAAPKSVLATAILRTNNGSSTTAPPEESPEASS